MKAIKYMFSGLVVAVALFVVGVKTANASEGIFELRNRVGEQARCVAYSVLMQDRKYDILMSCRDILYPGGTDVFSYVVWAVPTDGGAHFRLGSLGLGKVSFGSNYAFSSLYVTKETDDRVRSPQGPVIMQGSLQRSELLDGPAPTPNPNELGEPTPSPIATPQPRNLGRIFAAGGVIAFIAIFGVILVVFVITRK